MGGIPQGGRDPADQHAADQSHARHHRRGGIPKSLEQKLAVLPIRLDAMDALGLALQAGSAKAVNLVLLGRLSKYFHFTDAQWQDAICRSVPAKFLELNRKAFALGAEA